MQQNWWKHFFDDDYLTLYAGKLTSTQTAAEISCVEKILKDQGYQEGDHILDLACGEGRHAVPLSQLGFKITGLDHSQDLLRVAQMSEESKGGNIEYVQGDMRDLPFKDAAFDVVINLFSSFGFFTDDEENERVIQEVSRVLVPHGIFILDLRNMYQISKMPKHANTHTGEDGAVFQVEGEFDQSTQFWSVDIHWSKNDREIHKTYHLRLYSKEEIVSMLSRYDLQVIDVLGNYDYQPYSLEQSDRMIIVARKGDGS